MLPSSDPSFVVQFVTRRRRLSAQREQHPAAIAARSPFARHRSDVRVPQGGIDS
jgi:hypothetical protein